MRVAGLTEHLEGELRGTAHFDGVATVVAKLLNMVGPDVAYFGQKDAQQAAVIRRLVRDLDLPVRVEICPTIREPDGLALSSRNVHLRGADRERALALKRGLDAVAAAYAAGERDPQAIARRRPRRDGAARRRAGVPRARAPRRPPPGRDPRRAGEVLVAVAARVGPTRLIDNTILRPPARVRTSPTSPVTPPRRRGRLREEPRTMSSARQSIQVPADASRLPMTLPRLAEKKRLGEPIVMVTAYDYPSARAAESAGVDLVLVGDSGAMTVLGYPSTVAVETDEMLVLDPRRAAGAEHPVPHRRPPVRLLRGLRRAGRRDRDALRQGGGLRRGQARGRQPIAVARARAIVGRASP